MSMDFTAIDFETANPQRSSVCAVGLSRVRDGEIVEQYYSLVQPPTGLNSFQSYNTSIHGITPSMLEEAPPWISVLQDVLVFIGEDTIIAHNAPFDRSVLQRSSEAIGLNALQIPQFLCTLRASKALLRLGSYSLPMVTAELGLKAFDHHHALNDSDAAALVAVALTRRAGFESIMQLASLSAPAKRTQRDLEVDAQAWVEVATENSLVGETVCFTGGLKTMPRKVAQEVVTRLGGQISTGFTKKTTILVVGNFDPAKLRAGYSVSRKVEQALTDAVNGRNVEVLSEAEFLELVEITPEEASHVMHRKS